ncbi:MAG: phosphoglucosamine mutase [Holosporales bacterium]|nr:phosphoglucosamine mutase [Holosporales bacterium]
MASKLFGTDGIRGVANSGLITPESIMRLAMAVANYFKRGDFNVVIGKDTRLSGYMLESALMTGFTALGANVFLLGPIPTPAVSFMTRTMRADLGVVISASHNHYMDNGVKFFNNKGFKISSRDEEAITNLFYGNEELKLCSPENMGRAKRIEDISGRYVEFVKGSFTRNMMLSGWKIVVDAANGAAYRVAPNVFWELGADVITIGAEPDGYNINRECGATEPRLLQQKVIEHGADIGFALDGDADRLIVVDNEGAIIDGDYIIATIATDWKARNKLRSNKIVVTNMSNTGLEKYLDSIGLVLEKSDVGDKNVVEKMIQTKSNLGGEKSGHIIPIDYTTTGDGLIAALQVLDYLVTNSKRASDIRKLYTPFPQIFRNINREVDSINITKATSRVLNGRGRVVVRQSGTEGVTRLMIEAEDTSVIDTAMNLIKELIA